MTEIEIRSDLKLVQLSEKHARELFEVTDQNRIHLREWLPWLDNTTKREDTVLFIRGTKNMSGLNFAIFLEEKIVGCVGHNQYSPANKTASLGYWLSKEAGGKGVMSDSVKGLIDFTFREMEVECIDIKAATENKKSRALAERLGFQFEGILRQREWLYDHFVDHASYSILKSEWPSSAV